MMRKVLSLFVILLFVSTTSGCLKDPLNQSSKDGGQISGDESSWTHGLSSSCTSFDEIERCWDIYAPESIDPQHCLENSCPLVFDFHGFNSNPEIQKTLSGFDDLSDEFGFIVVYPLGYENSWNSGWCCGEASENGIDDLGFILEISEQVENIWNTDNARRYLTGYSNGCSMVQKLANELSQFFTAAGCMAHYLLEPPSSNYSPIPLMEVHGVHDPVIPYGETYGFSPWVQHSCGNDCQGAISNLELWADMNGCSGSTPDIEIFEFDYSILGYNQCQNNASVQLFTLNLAHHNPYKKDYPSNNLWAPVTSDGNPTGIDSSLIVWEFLSQYTKLS